jgi:hypothetical protein
MKSLKITTLLFFATAFAFAQNITVQGNTALNIDFKKFKTYGWAQTDNTAPGDEYVIYSYAEDPNSPKPTANTGAPTDVPYIYAYNIIIPASDANVNATIKSEIAAELEGRGYKRNDATPDLLVSYKVLEGRGRLKGYTTDTPEIVSGTQVHTPEDTTTYTLQPGTLLINLIDKKNSKVVWDGFASGLIQGDAFTADPTKLKEAVHLIFEKFKSTADKKISQVR